MRQLHKIFSLLLLASFTSCAAPIKNAQTESFKVAGKCEMCKNVIETTANMKGVTEAEWDVKTKMLKLTFNPEKISSSDVLKRIAYAGYDNEEFLAPDEAYAKLPDCCKYDRLKRNSTVVENQDQKEKTDSITEEKQQANELSDVYEQYFLLKDALVRDNAAVASMKAKTLSKAIDAVDEKTMTTEESTSWKKAKQELATNASQIAELTNIDTQRERFALLSQNMITLVKVFKAEQTVYVQHCPMYNDGEGADWLSKEAGVKNPYYGSSMLTCGKTTSTIK